MTGAPSHFVPVVMVPTITSILVHAALFTPPARRPSLALPLPGQSLYIYPGEPEANRRHPKYDR